MAGKRPDISFSTTKPKLEPTRSGLVDAVSFDVPQLQIDSAVSPTGTGESESGEGGDQWKEFFLNLGVQDLVSEDALQGINNFLKRVDKVINALTVILKILRLVSSDFLNPARALKFAIKQLVKTLQDIVDSFVSTGIYLCVIRPDDSEKDDTYIIPTWGSFGEFKAKIAAACLDAQNPQSPSRLTKNNIVGGFIIGGLAGTNDPSLLDDMLSNLSLLSDLFGFDASLPSPPKNVKAYAGHFRGPGGGSGKQPGVKISWDKPDSKGIVGYRVFRCRIKEGLNFSSEERDEIILKHPLRRRPEYVRDIEKSRIYRDEGFEPEFVLGGIARDKFSYIDYDVEEGDTYYYSVMSVIKGDGLVDNDPWNRRTDSPLMSQPVSVTPSFCIPLTTLSDKIQTLDGDFISAEGSYRFNWKSRTLRTYFGPLLDDLLDRVDGIADNLLGLVQTSSDAVSEYIDFLGNKVKTYIQIVQTITDIVLMIVSFKLRGSLLVLNLSAESGGIQNFADRVMRSEVDSSTFNRNDRSEGRLGDIKGYYFGIVSVYGFPGSEEDNQYLQGYLAPYAEEYNSVKKKFDDNQKSIKTLLKLFLGE